MRRPLRLAALAFSLAVPAAASDRVVIAADSHGIGGFGWTLEDWLRGRPNTSYAFAANGGSAPLQWTKTKGGTTCGIQEDSSAPPSKPACRPPCDSARACGAMPTPHLDKLWEAQPPRDVLERRVTIIAHGTNLPVKDRAGSVAACKEMIRMAYANSDVCVWIGPPDMTRFETGPMYSIIEEAIAAVQGPGGARCRLVRSAEFTKYPARSGDGVHYHWLPHPHKEDFGLAAQWAEGVKSRLRDVFP